MIRAFRTQFTTVQCSWIPDNFVWQNFHQITSLVFQCIVTFITRSSIRWYRGTVLSYNKSDKTYRIFFVDFGDSANVHCGNVQAIADRLINDYKFYAIQCSLANIKPFGKILVQLQYYSIKAIRHFI